MCHLLGPLHLLSHFQTKHKLKLLSERGSKQRAKYAFFMFFFLGGCKVFYMRKTASPVSRTISKDVGMGIAWVL